MFATAALNIEAETSRVITAHPRRGQLTEQFANRSECARVGHRVRPWCSANRTLVHHNCLVDLFHSANCPITAWLFLRIMETSKHRRSQDLAQQSGRARPRQRSNQPNNTAR